MPRQVTLKILYHIYCSTYKLLRLWIRHTWSSYHKRTLRIRINVWGPQNLILKSTKASSGARGVSPLGESERGWLHDSDHSKKAQRPGTGSRRWEHPEMGKSVGHHNRLRQVPEFGFYVKKGKRGGVSSICHKRKSPMWVYVLIGSWVWRYVSPIKRCKLTSPPLFPLFISLSLSLSLSLCLSLLYSIIGEQKLYKMEVDGLDLVNF